MQMPDGYRVPDDPDAGRMDAAYLRTCLGIPTPLSGSPPELPLSVRRAHFFISHALKRLGAMGRTGMDATQIAMVVAMAEMQRGFPAEPEACERTFLDDLNDGRVNEGDKVVIRYRAQDHVAHFLRTEDDVVVVLHEGKERKCSPVTVRMPSAGEFPNVEALLVPAN